MVVRAVAARFPGRLSGWSGKFALFFLAALLFAALGTGLLAQDYDLTVYRQTRGLDNLTVNDLAFDRQGFLWVGTENGLYRFLGSNFERFGAREGLTDHDIQEVYASPDGVVWAGTNENLYRWTGMGFVPAGPKPIKILNSEHLAAEAPGRLLVVDRNRLYRLVYARDGKPLSYQPVFPDSASPPEVLSRHLEAIHRDPDGTLWMGCDYGICSWAKEKWVERSGAQGIPKEVWHSFRRDQQGNLWAVSEHHVLVLPRGADRFLDRTPSGNEPNTFFRRTPIALDGQGRIVVSTLHGLARWENNAWKNFGQANGFQTSYFSALLFDANGDPWLGSSGRGLYLWIGYNDWEGWTDDQGLPSAIIWSTGIFRDGYSYVGTEEGPARIDLRTGVVEKLFLGKKWRYGQVSGMAFDVGGQILAGTFTGKLLRIDPKTRAAQLVTTLPVIIETLVPDATGHIFLVTDQGVYQADSKQAARPPRKVAEIDRAFGGKPPWVTTGCIAPGGDAWFATGMRVFGFVRGQWIFPEISGFPTTLPDLFDVACAADGSLWVNGQRSGTWHLTWNAGHWSAKELPVPEEDRQLEPLAVLSDPRGWLWIGTDNGVLVWNGTSWRHLTRESGLVWNDINGGRLISGPDQTIWFGTSGGLGHLIHPERVFDPLKLDVAITQTRRGAQAVESSAGFTLPWSNRSLAFQFATPLTLNRSDLVFKYRIPELNSEWTVTAETAAQFNALPPGDYTFQLLASNPARGAMSALVTSRFRVLPPWWRTNWFYSLAALTLIAFLWLLYFLRTRHLLRLKHYLEAQVRERTVELEASREELRIQATYDGLTGLLNRTAILRALATEIERARREGKRLAVALADIDHFKNVNDTHGHLTGDQALRRFAKAMTSVVRPYDHVGRYGGEEFLLILTDVPEDLLHERLSMLHAGMTNLTIEAPECTLTINCSLGGIVVDPARESASSEAILTIADLALYDAKAAGRNRAIWRTASGAKAGLAQGLVEGKLQNPSGIDSPATSVPRQTVEISAAND